MSDEESITTDDMIDNIIQSVNLEQRLEQRKAPAIIGKPVFADDLKWAEMAGAKGYSQIFGKKVTDENGADAVLPLNFGSKKDVGFMPDDVRLRLFNLKKCISSCEIQASYIYKNQHITVDMFMDTPMYKRHLLPLLKAYNITDFSNWIPTIQSRFYFEEYEIPFLLADQFDSLPMDAPTMEVPGDLGHLEGFEETDVATFTEQSTTQAKYTVTARNCVTHAKISEDLLADSAPKIIDRQRKEVVSGVARAYEKAIINGDTTGSPRGASHQDSDIAALALNATYQKAFDGLRKKAFANDTALGAGTIVYDHGGDSPSKTMFAKMLAMAGKFGNEKSDWFWLLPSSIETAVVTGAIPELFTAFALGGIASNVTGQMPPIFGVKSVVSQFAREDLAANGKYFAASNLTAALLVRKSRFAQFWRQAPRVWAAPTLPSSDQMLMTSKARMSWNGNPQSANEIGVTMAINVAKV